MEPNIYNALYYYNENGEEGYDMFEVLFLETLSPDRIVFLKTLLNHENKQIVYQAMLILIAWNIDDVFKKFEQFFSERWDITEEFFPHRIWGDDNVYDQIANVFDISMCNGKTGAELIPYIEKLLSIYDQVFFESNLKALLLSGKIPDVLQFNLDEIITKTLNAKRYYQASQLWTVIVKYDKTAYNKYKNTFVALVDFDTRIQFNIDESLKYSV